MSANKSNLKKLNKNLDSETANTSEKDVETMVNTEKGKTNTNFPLDEKAWESEDGRSISKLTEEQKEILKKNKETPVHGKVEFAPEVELGGLDGNPGQRHRFDRMMENHSGATSKYFSSGKK